MDHLAVARCVGHEQGGSGGNRVGGLNLDADARHKTLEIGQHAALGPSGGQGVDADGQVVGLDDRDETSPETMHGVLGGSWDSRLVGS